MSDMAHSDAVGVSVPTQQVGKPVLTIPAWAWYASRDEETYLVGPESSREAVIQAATQDFDGEPFHIVEACKGSMSRYIPTGKRIIEWMVECSDDEGAFGEDDYCELVGSAEAIAAAEADAAQVLSEWFARHSAIFPTPWAFLATRNGEWVRPDTPTQPESSTQ